MGRKPKELPSGVCLGVLTIGSAAAGRFHLAGRRHAGEASVRSHEPRWAGEKVKKLEALIANGALKLPSSNLTINKMDRLLERAGKTLGHANGSASGRAR